MRLQKALCRFVSLSDGQLEEHEKMVERMAQLSKGEIVWKS